MIQININNKKVVNSLNPNPSLQRMINYIIEEKIDKNEIITKIIIDDKKIDLDDEKELCKLFKATTPLTSMLKRP